MKKYAKMGFIGKTLLGAGGASVVGGAGAGGYLYGKKKGIQSGAEMMADELGRAFLTANAKENSKMQSAWESKNKIENAQIANHFLRKGYQMGQKTASTLEAVYNAAFEDELEKIAISVPGMKGLGQFANKVPGAISAAAGKTRQVLVNTAKSSTDKAVKATGAVAEGAVDYTKYLGRQWPALATGGGIGLAGGVAGGVAMGKQSSDELIGEAIDFELQKLGFTVNIPVGKAMSHLKGVGGRFKNLAQTLTSTSKRYAGKAGRKIRVQDIKGQAKHIKGPLATLGIAGAGGAGYAAGQY